ncbi:MAG: sulfur oxidation c-type cytochrome SoxA [Janthinobacterium lividum]
MGCPLQSRALLLPLGLLVLGVLTGAAGRSGHEDASPPVQAMQNDDSQNPAMLWVQQGETVWAAGCASCHGAVQGMKGVSARYPVVEDGQVLTLSRRVNQCRTERMHQPAWGMDDDAMLAVTGLVGLQSRGLPMSVPADGAAAPVLAEGQRLFTRRMGQLDLSCAQCHDTLAGQRLGGSRIPQGQPNGYPLYRLEWQAMGSLDRRLRNCMTGVRAEPLPPDSPEMGALQLYLGVRSNGMPVETPGVRP